jgi:hypothetical protein
VCCTVVPVSSTSGSPTMLVPKRTLRIPVLCVGLRVRMCMKFADVSLHAILMVVEE